MSSGTRRPRIPSYRLHKASGQAVVTLSGKDFYLGAFGGGESHAEYERIISEWLARGRLAAASSKPGTSVLVSDLLLAYWTYAGTIYRRNTLLRIRAALRPLRKLYGHTAAADFTPVAMKTVRQSLVELRKPDGGSKLCRGTINYYTHVVRQVFKWGVAEGYVAAGVWQALLAVDGLRRGRTAVRESKPVLPVLDEVIDRTLPHMPAIVADMTRVQRLTGMRPGELCAMTMGELEMVGKVWVYRPTHHKTEHHGKDRTVVIGPRAQLVLRRYLHTDLSSPVFRSPRTGIDGSPRPYTEAAYRRAINRACTQAGIPSWAPNQLRHTRATELRREFGLDAAGAVLGHSKLETTQIYAERSVELAAKVAMATG